MLAAKVGPAKSDREIAGDSPAEGKRVCRIDELNCLLVDGPQMSTDDDPAGDSKDQASLISGPLGHGAPAGQASGRDERGAAELSNPHQVPRNW
jgi:hypothetical protein